MGPDLRMQMKNVRAYHFIVPIRSPLAILLTAFAIRSTFLSSEVAA